MNKQDLINKIIKYKPLDSRESNNRIIILNFLQDNDNCFSRSNKYGHITSGALVISKDGEILLNHHMASDMWFQFGGHCDGNENVFESAMREVEEESGLTGFVPTSMDILDLDIQDIPERKSKNEPEHIHYDVNFLVVANNKTYVVSKESKEIVWCTPEEALELVSDTDYGIIRMINKAKEYIQTKLNVR